jgi:hypothetical protein
MRKLPMQLAIAAIPLLSAPAYAQNTKGTGAETRTTTTTNPIGTSVIATPQRPEDRQQPSVTDKGQPIDKGNPGATRESQSLGNPRNGLVGSSK